MPRFQVLVDARLAEHVPALCDNDILLSCMTYIALQQASESIDFILKLLYCFTGVGILHHAIHFGCQQLQQHTQQQEVRCSQ